MPSSSPRPASPPTFDFRRDARRASLLRARPFFHIAIPQTSVGSKVLRHSQSSTRDLRRAREARDSHGWPVEPPRQSTMIFFPRL
ncbi:uncharacterized protein A4U43_C07F5100 [Asparagus officinalis]|uniref:Uncharacterized protein n=1 Tax=Asparagus officinalis TaxID=4686 RepID=A0A5P1E9G3_ASPOF|nr:uncharacterized protein A4U43_C07F5100 [Asparagus officinalis]